MSKHFDGRTGYEKEEIKMEVLKEILPKIPNCGLTTL